MLFYNIPPKYFKMVRLYRVYAGSISVKVFWIIEIHKKWA